MKKTVKYLVGLSTLAFLSACGNGNGSMPTEAEKTLDKLRWYSARQVDAGGKVFAEHCAGCHGADAAGSPNWRETDAAGKYPPPPLNGTAHAWHHPKAVLRMTIRHGGVPLGGSMPGFVKKLDDKQIDAVIAWIQSHWSDEIYAAWAKRNAQAAIRQENRK